MSVSALLSRIRNGALVAGAVIIGTAAVAQAATVQFKVANQSGGTITLDTSSCTSGYVSAPFSIPNGSTATFSGTTTDTTTLCTVRYQKGNLGCQFQVQVSNFGGFASTNAYKGSGGKPVCTKIDEGNSQPGTYYGVFSMQ